MINNPNITVDSTGQYPAAGGRWRCLLVHLNRRRWEHLPARCCSPAWTSHSSHWHTSSPLGQVRAVQHRQELVRPLQYNINMTILYTLTALNQQLVTLQSEMCIHCSRKGSHTVLYICMIYPYLVCEQMTTLLFSSTCKSCTREEVISSLLIQDSEYQNYCLSVAILSKKRKI